MIVLGITGSIGMGKSTASTMLEILGVPTQSSDAAVHDLLKPGSEAWAALNAAFPYFAYPQIYDLSAKFKFWLHPSKRKRTVNRKALGKLVFASPREREKLEKILHPFVRQRQDQFIREQKALGHKMVALDIPLLFETGADTRLDAVINISAPAHIQKARVLARPNMDQKKFEAILKTQMSDGEKCARADFVIHSGLGRAYMMRELKSVLNAIRMNAQKDAA